MRTKVSTHVVYILPSDPEFYVSSLCLQFVFCCWFLPKLKSLIFCVRTLWRGVTICCKICRSNSKFTHQSIPPQPAEWSCGWTKITVSSLPIGRNIKFSWGHRLPKWAFTWTINSRLIFPLLTLLSFCSVSVWSQALCILCRQNYAHTCKNLQVKYRSNES